MYRTQVSAAQIKAQIDQGLRSYFIGIYNRMTLGLIVTGLAAWFGIEMFGETLQQSPWLNLAVVLMPLAFVILLMIGISSFSVGVANVLFYVYSASVGVSFTTLLMMYKLESVFQVFFITAGMFAATSLYGYTTKRDLTKFGSFFMMALIGLLIAMVVNIFMASSVFAFFISLAAVTVFVGLTAFDTQLLKEEYLSNGAVYGYDNQDRSSIHGALTLYLNFINIFIHLLSILGQKKD